MSQELKRLMIEIVKKFFRSGSNLIDGFLQQKKIFDADLKLHVTCFVVLTVCYFFEINFISIEMLFIGDLKECQQCPVVQNS